MKPIITLFVACAWLAAAGCATAQPSETRRFSGVYVNGWEVQLFIESGRENEQPYWVAMTPEAREAIEAVMPRPLPQSEGVRVVTEFDGRLSPPGRYGHLGVYEHTVLFEHVISAALETPERYRCDAEAETEWRAPNGGQVYSVRGFSSGEDCERAAVFLVVRDQAGQVVWTHSAAAKHLFGVRDADSRGHMAYALNEWVTYASQRPQTTADLPEWREGADAPGGEFPFYPEDWIDRAGYLELRQQAEPMFCYVQGMESLACLTAYFDRLEKIGVQSFPG